MHTDSTRPSPGALPPRPCDASWSLPRLLHCGRLGAASQAATGTAATPQLPLKLLLLLLGCYCEWPKRRRKTTTELPLLPAPAPEPPPPPPPGLPSPSLLLLPPPPPPRLPRQPSKPLGGLQRGHTERGEKRDTNGRRMREKGGNGRQARARGWVVVGAAAGLGKAARRAPAAAAGRVRGRAYVPPSQA